MFMSAEIKPVVDETIRRVLLNKPWYFNLEQSVCVCCVLESLVAMPAKRKNSEGKSGGGAQSKGGWGGRRDLFGKSCMVV